MRGEHAQTGHVCCAGANGEAGAEQSEGEKNIRLVHFVGGTLGELSPRRVMNASGVNMPHGVSFRELATGGRPLRRTGCHRDFGRIRHISGDCGKTGPFIKDVPEYRKL